jgi:hypothetical protein
MLQFNIQLSSAFALWWRNINVICSRACGHPCVLIMLASLHILAHTRCTPVPWLASCLCWGGEFHQHLFTHLLFGPHPSTCSSSVQLSTTEHHYVVIRLLFLIFLTSWCTTLFCCILYCHTHPFL